GQIDPLGDRRDVVLELLADLLNLRLEPRRAVGLLLQALPQKVRAALDDVVDVGGREHPRLKLADHGGVERFDATPEPVRADRRAAAVGVAADVMRDVATGGGRAVRNAGSDHAAAAAAAAGES